MLLPTLIKLLSNFNIFYPDVKFSTLVRAYQKHALAMGAALFVTLSQANPIDGTIHTQFGSNGIAFIEQSNLNVRSFSGLIHNKHNDWPYAIEVGVSPATTPQLTFKRLGLNGLGIFAQTIALPTVFPESLIFDGTETVFVKDQLHAVSLADGSILLAVPWVLGTTNDTLNTADTRKIAVYKLKPATVLNPGYQLDTTFGTNGVSIIASNHWQLSARINVGLSHIFVASNIVEYGSIDGTFKLGSQLTRLKINGQISAQNTVSNLFPAQNFECLDFAFTDDGQIVGLYKLFGLTSSPLIGNMVKLVKFQFSPTSNQVVSVLPISSSHEAVASGLNGNITDYSFVLSNIWGQFYKHTWASLLSPAPNQQLLSVNPYSVSSNSAQTGFGALRRHGLAGNSPNLISTAFLNRKDVSHILARASGKIISLNADPSATAADVRRHDSVGAVDTSFGSAGASSLPMTASTLFAGQSLCVGQAEGKKYLYSFHRKGNASNYVTNPASLGGYIWNEGLVKSEGTYISRMHYSQEANSKPAMFVLPNQHAQANQWKMTSPVQMTGLANGYIVPASASSDSTDQISVRKWNLTSGWGDWQYRVWVTNNDVIQARVKAPSGPGTVLSTLTVGGAYDSCYADRNPAETIRASWKVCVGCN